MQRRAVLSLHQAISLAVLFILVILALWLPRRAEAALPLPPNPQQGSIGIEGTIPSPPPKQGATITVPTTGQVFTNATITVSGLCPTGLLVKIFSNNVFVGAVQCVNGSYSIQINLFNGRNDLVARVYDALDQAGPDSNIVTVTLNDAQVGQFGNHMFLTSAYAKRGANPGERLDWPVIIGGGSPPYAISVDWGDNKQQDLISLSDNGTFTINHIYDHAGIYNIIIRGTDKNGTSAFLQLVGVANGTTQNVPAGQKDKTQCSPFNLWKAIAISIAICIPLLLISFFIGQKYELLSLRRHLERSAENIDET